VVRRSAGCWAPTTEVGWRGEWATRTGRLPPSTAAVVEETADGAYYVSARDHEPGAVYAACSTTCSRTERCGCMQHYLRGLRIGYPTRALAACHEAMDPTAKCRGIGVSRGDESKSARTRSRGGRAFHRLQALPSAGPSARGAARGGDVALVHVPVARAGTGIWLPGEPCAKRCTRGCWNDGRPASTPTAGGRAFLLGRSGCS